MANFIAVIVLIAMATGKADGMAGADGVRLSDEQIKAGLIGDWCLDREVFGSDTSHDGSIWRFLEDGRYYTSVDSPASWMYTVEGGRIRLENFGVMDVVSITGSSLVTRIHSTYHFLRDACLPETDLAMRLTAFNARVLSGDIDVVKAMVNDGIDISAADRRTMSESTPLMMAIKSGDLEMVKYVLGLQPDLSVENAMGQRALEVSERYGTEEIKGVIRDAYRK